MTLPWTTAPSIRARHRLSAVVLGDDGRLRHGDFVAVRHEFLEQLDDQLHDDFEAAEERLTLTPGGRATWTEDRHQAPEVAEGRIYEVWSSSGERIHRSGASGELLPPTLASLGSRYSYDTIAADNETWRALTASTTVSGHAVVLRVARSEERLTTQLWEILVVLVLGLPLVVVLAGIGGYVLARRALAPIDHLATEARRITADRLHERLRLKIQRRIGRLTGVINDPSPDQSSFEQLQVHG